MAKIANWIAEKTSTIGIGDLILTGAVVAKDNITFALGVPAGQVWYSIQDGVNREAGIGTFDGINTITRDTIHSTKKSNTYNNINPTPINLNGSAIVACTFNSAAFDDFVVNAALDEAISSIRDVPVWNQSFSLGNWAIGDVINILLSDGIISDGSPNTTVFSVDPSSVTPNNNGLPAGLTLDSVAGSGGLITGTISASQGGTYNLNFKAVNEHGSSQLSTAVVVIDLVVGAPTFSTVDNQVWNQGQSMVPLNMNDYLIDDGDSSKISLMAYVPDFSSATLPDNISLNINGILSGSVDALATIQAYSIVIKGTNEAGFSALIPFTFNVQAASVVDIAPTFNAGWSGAAFCGTGNPIWNNPMPNLFQEVGQSLNYNVSAFLSSEGSTTVTGYTVNTGVFPNTISMDASGQITGTIDAGQDGTYTLTYTATSSTGSTNSVDQVITVTNPAAIAQPTITSIDATDGTSDVYVNFDESVTTASATAIELEAGFALTINTTARTFVYVSGAGTSRIRYSTDATITGSNTLLLTYVEASGNLYSVANGASQPVSDSTQSFVVPAPPAAGVFFSDDFSSGDFNGVQGGGSWLSRKNTLINSLNPKTGQYSMEMKFTSGGSAEIRFKLPTRYLEFWAKYELFIPTNYTNPADGAGAPNNKSLLMTWGDTGGYSNDGYENSSAPKYHTHWYSLADNGSMLIAQVLQYQSAAKTATYNYASSSTALAAGDSGKKTHIRVPSSLGRWETIVEHRKMPSSPGATDGMFEIWSTDDTGSRTKLVDLKTILPDVYSTEPDGSPSRGWNVGYFLGSANRKPSSTMYFYIDNIIFSTESLL